MVSGFSLVPGGKGQRGQMSESCDRVPEGALPQSLPCQWTANCGLGIQCLQVGLLKGLYSHIASGRINVCLLESVFLPTGLFPATWVAGVA